MKNNKKYPISVNWRRYFDINNETVYLYMSTYGQRMYVQMYNKLKYAIRMKLPYVTLLKFYEIESTVTVYEYEYLTLLNCMLSICIKMEYYELCSDISKTIKQLDNLNRKYYKLENEFIS
jgi:hypothetical protein